MGKGTELAKAYVQIIPSADGISGKISQLFGGEASNAGNSAGKVFGKNLGSTLIKTIGALGIGQALKDSLLKGADLQQSMGGVETLFKDHANAVIDNAKRAYETAGLSANAYMETVTGFSASLLQSLGGDTEAAAGVADRAIIDMSDNANKMGTSMELIQNAYQGFAKQNYTMLDNLKLGYGGTQAEMQRLIADAAAMTDVQEKLGITVDASSMSFDNVINAISVMQSHLEISGATASEASTTFSGSFNAMKAAADNFMANLSLGQDIKPALFALGDSVMTFAIDNLFPMVLNIAASVVELVFTTDWGAVGINMVKRIKSGINEAALKYLGTDKDIVGAIVSAVNEGLPKVLKRGAAIVTNIVNGILEKIPSIIRSGTKVVNKLVSCISDNLPKVLKAGTKLLLKLANGFSDNFPKITAVATKAVASIVKTIGENLPSVLRQGIKILAELAAGLIKAIPDLVKQIPKIIESITKAFKDVDWKTVGTNILQGIAAGLSDAGNIILQAVQAVAGDALKGVKKLLGIKSPSRVFRDEVGKMMDLGVAVGITDNANEVTNAMRNLTKSTLGMAETDLNYTANVNGTVVAESNAAVAYRLEQMEKSCAEILYVLQEGISIDWDDRNLGRLVRTYA